MNDAAVLTVNDLKTYFYLTSGIARAVDGVSFSVAKGETLGVVGESGSGKSVMAKSIIRLMTKTSRICGGDISFDGRDVLAMTDKELLNFRGWDVGMIFQDPISSLDPVFRVGYQMVESIMAHSRVSSAQARDTAIDAMGRVGIPDPQLRFDAYPFELSGGMCQRIVIAMVLCSKAKLIIADEPTTALDVTVQSQVLDLLKELQRQNEAAMLLITHNLGIVWETCDNVMVMYAGKTVEFASARDLYTNSLHPYTWGLLDSMPSLTLNAKEELNSISGMPPDLRLTGTCCSFCTRCVYSKDICRSEAPPLLEVSANHFVACHFQNQDKHLTRRLRT